MLSRQCLVLMFASCFWHAAAPHSLAEDAQAPTAEAVARQVAEAERRIVNLHVPKCEVRFEVLAPGAADWQEEPNTISGEAWYGGLRHSKARVDVTRKMEWEGGAAKWVEVTQDLGFDGQFGRIANHSSTYSGRTHPDRTGELLPDAPALLYDRFQSYADGTGFTLGYFVDSRGRLLSEVLAKSLNEGAKPKVYQETWRDHRVVRLTFGNVDEASISYWFDPARGWALVKAEQKLKLPNGTWLVPELIEVLELAEASPGLWYPTEAMREEPYPGKPGYRLRVRYESTGVVTNDPDFDETVFAVPFPAGYIITDKVRDRVFEAPGGVVVPAPEEPGNALQRNAPLKAQVPPATLPAALSAAVGATRNWTMAVAIIAAVAGVMLLAIWLFAVRRGN